MLNTGYGKLNKWCLSILTEAIPPQHPERSLSQVGRTQQCSTTYSPAQGTEKVINHQFTGIFSLWAQIALHGLQSYLIFLLLCCASLALLTQTISYHIVQCFTTSCQTDLISCQVNLISVFDKVTKWIDSKNTAGIVLSGFCKGDDKVLWCLCGQDGQKMKQSVDSRNHK